MSTGDATNHSEPVDGDLTCQPCGYNLRGLQRSDRCPECGSEVDCSWPVFSAESTAWMGPALRLAERGMIVHFVGLLTVVLHPATAICSCFMVASATRRLRSPIRDEVRNEELNDAVRGAAFASTGALVVGLIGWVAALALVHAGSPWWPAPIPVHAFIQLRSLRRLLVLCRELARIDGADRAAIHFDELATALECFTNAALVMGAFLAIPLLNVLFFYLLPLLRYILLPLAAVGLIGCLFLQILLTSRFRRRLMRRFVDR